MLYKDTLRLMAVFSTLIMMFTIIYSLNLKVKENAMHKRNNYVQGSPITQTPEPVSITPEPVKNDVQYEVELLPITVWDTVSGVMDSPVFDELTDNLIILSKSEFLSGNEEIELIDLAVDRQIQFIIRGITDSNFMFTNIYRVIEEEFYDEPILEPSPTPTPTPTPNAEESEEEADENSDTSQAGADQKTDEDKDSTDKHHQQDEHENEILVNSDPIQSRIIKYIEDENGTYTASVTFHLNKTYAYNLLEDEAYFYICLMRPKDVYDKIVVIDAGHGGLDSGTYSKNYVYLEKDMNISILLYLKELLDQDDEIMAYYTRITDRRLTLNQRVNLANDLEADFFISIHCNSNPSVQVNGTEVLYNDKQNDWEGMNSKRFSIICQEESVKSIGLANRGIVPRSHNVHIISEAKMPVALIEVAFMTNTKDLEVLVKKDNHKALAGGLYQAIKRAYTEIEEEKNHID